MEFMAKSGVVNAGNDDRKREREFRRDPRPQIRRTFPSRRRRNGVLRRLELDFRFSVVCNMPAMTSGGGCCDSCGCNCGGDDGWLWLWWLVIVVVVVVVNVVDYCGY